MSDHFMLVVVFSAVVGAMLGWVASTVDDYLHRGHE